MCICIFSGQFDRPEVAVCLQDVKFKMLSMRSEKPIYPVSQKFQAPNVAFNSPTVRLTKVAGR